jgi:hypothetical protein
MDDFDEELGKTTKKRRRKAICDVLKKVTKNEKEAVGLVVNFLKRSRLGKKVTQTFMNDHSFMNELEVGERQQILNELEHFN